MDPGTPCWGKNRLFSSCSSRKSNSCAALCQKTKSPVMLCLIDLNIRLFKAVSYNLGKDHWLHLSKLILKSFITLFFKSDSCLQYPLSLLLSYYLSCFPIRAHLPHTKIKLSVNCKHNNVWFSIFQVNDEMWNNTTPGTLK